MALRKLYIVLDCDDDQQKEQVQSLLNEVSNARMLNGRQLVSMAPIIQRNRTDITELFNMIRQGGIKAIMSMRGGLIISRISKNK